LIVENKICDRNFIYLEPWFYNNNLAMRCELGIGDTDEEYMQNAEQRAMEIFDILFANGIDAIFYDFYEQDFLKDGEANQEPYTRNFPIYVKKQLEFTRVLFNKYRHLVLKDLKTNDDFDDIHRHRIICYMDNKKLNHNKYIHLNVFGHENRISFVSFENECIYSIYDDRGCDIVFFTKEKFIEFYEKLQPYFLNYDVAIMKDRYFALL